MHQQSLPDHGPVTHKNYTGRNLWKCRCR